MQHLISNYREEDVENEAATEIWMTAFARTAGIQFVGKTIRRKAQNGQKRTMGRHKSNPLGLGTDGEPQRLILVQN